MKLREVYGKEVSYQDSANLRVLGDLCVFLSERIQRRERRGYWRMDGNNAVQRALTKFVKFGKFPVPYAEQFELSYVPVYAHIPTKWEHCFTIPAGWILRGQS